MSTDNDEYAFRTDICVYGATPGGIAAACVAAELGANVTLLGRGAVVGGHLTSGICTTECEHMLPISFGGWMMRLLRRIGHHYDLDFPLHRWEPRVALESFRELLSEASVPVELETVPEEVTLKQGRIVRVRFSGGRRVEAKAWIDASYEGDLMAMAGVTYRVGRESTEEWGESLAGFRFIDSLDEVQNSKGHAHRIDEIHKLDLLDETGAYLHGVTKLVGSEAEGADMAALRGCGDGKVMNYHFRATVTRAKERIPFPKPPEYDENRFELLARFLHRNPDTPLRGVVGFIDNPSGSYGLAADGFTEVEPGDKWELNNHQASVLSLGYLGGQFDYPDGDEETRARVIADHYEQNAGLLYFLSNSPEVPQRLREEARSWGLPPDEYVDNGNWPWQPYIRETRRMQGELVLTQHDILKNRNKPDLVFWNSHWIDSHHIQRVALDETHFRNEGRIWKELTEPYAVPYRALLPKGEECTNLLVPGCLSSTHVAFASLRLESSWMGLGEVAGRAAAIAVEDECTVQEVDIHRLQESLRAGGVTL